jgi:hypothetical protein
VNLEQLGASSFNEESVDKASSQHTSAKEYNTSIPQDAATLYEEDTTFESAIYTLKQMTLDSDQNSFFGKLSQIMLVKTTLDLKNEYLGQDHDSHVPSITKRPIKSSSGKIYLERSRCSNVGCSH